MKTRRILAEIVRRRETPDDTLAAQQQAWLPEAKAALAVPSSLVKTMTDYSRDPAELRSWCTRLADLIDSSSMPDIDPWGSDFGVRGR